MSQLHCSVFSKWNDASCKPLLINSMSSQRVLHLHLIDLILSKCNLAHDNSIYPGRVPGSDGFVKNTSPLSMWVHVSMSKTVLETALSRTPWGGGCGWILTIAAKSSNVVQMARCLILVV